MGVEGGHEPKDSQMGQGRVWGWRGHPREGLGHLLLLVPTLTMTRGCNGVTVVPLGGTYRGLHRLLLLLWELGLGVPRSAGEMRAPMWCLLCIWGSYQDSPKGGQPSLQRQQEQGKPGSCPVLLAQGFISPFFPDVFSGRWLTSGKPWGKVTQPWPWLMPGEGPLLTPPPFLAFAEV